MAEDLAVGLALALSLLPMVLAIVMSLTLRVRTAARHATTLRLTYVHSRGAFSFESLISIPVTLCVGFLAGLMTNTV